MQINKPTKAMIDDFTGYPVVVQSDHTYIHQGLGFNIAGLTTSLAAGATYSASFTTPANGIFVHLRPTGLSSTANSLQLRIAENSIVTGGTALVARNRNRNSKKTSHVSVVGGVTIATEGDILQYAQVGGGTNASNASGGGNDGSAEEWVLKPGTTYSFRFENIGASTATIGYWNMFWYEEGEGE